MSIEIRKPKEKSLFTTYTPPVKKVVVKPSPVKKEKEFVLPNKFSALFRLALQAKLSVKCPDNNKICPLQTVGKLLDVKGSEIAIHDKLKQMNIRFHDVEYEIKCSPCFQRNKKYQFKGEFQWMDHAIMIHVQPMSEPNKELTIDQIIEMVSQGEDNITNTRDIVSVKVDVSGNIGVIREQWK